MMQTSTAATYVALDGEVVTYGSERHHEIVRHWLGTIAMELRPVFLRAFRDNGLGYVVDRVVDEDYEEALELIGDEFLAGTWKPCPHATTAECCDGWDERCLDCGRAHV